MPAKGNRVNTETMERIRSAVQQLAKYEYPKVWIGEVGMPADELLRLQNDNDIVPEWMRVKPGEFVEIEGGGSGIAMPNPSVDWLDGLWVLENMREALREDVGAELHEEVLYIHAAKQGMVPVVSGFEQLYTAYDAGIPLELPMKPPSELTPEDVTPRMIESLEFYEGDSNGPYVIEDSERARRALQVRLGEE